MTNKEFLARLANEKAEKTDDEKRLKYAHKILANERNRKVIHLRFWLGMTYKEIGKELGVTIERARQIEKKTIRAMRWMPLEDALGIVEESTQTT